MEGAQLGARRVSNKEFCGYSTHFQCVVGDKKPCEQYVNYIL